MQIKKSSCPITWDLLLPNLAFEFERIWLYSSHCLNNPSAFLLQPCGGLVSLQKPQETRKDVT